MRTSPTTTRPSTLLGRIAGWCFDHRRKAVGLWLVGLFAIFAAGGVVGSQKTGSADVPGSGSAAGFAVLEEHFPELGTGGQTGTIVFRATQGVEDPEVEAAMEGLFRQVDVGFPDDDGVAQHPGATVVSPYGERGSSQIARDGPLADQVAYAQVNFSSDVDDTESGLIGEAITDHAPAIDGLEVFPGGQYLVVNEPPASELIGLAFAMLVLIAAFGSVLAMGLPIAVALGGVGAGIGTTLLLSNVFTIPDGATVLGLMIGLGVGIDYALFIVSRYREGLHEGRSPREATVIAMESAGRAVVFAGTTVMISMLGLLLVGIASVGGMGVAVSVTVLATMVTSTVLLPALLGFAKERVELTALARPDRRRLHRPRPPRARAGHRPARGGRRRPRRAHAARQRRRPAAAPPGPPAGRQAGGGDARLPLESHHPAPPRPVDGGRHRRAAAAGRTGRQPAPRLGRRGQLPGGHADPAGVRPAGRRVRRRLQRPVRDHRRAAARRRRRRCRSCTRGRWPAPDGVATVSDPMPDDPTDPAAYMMSLVATTAPQDEATSALVRRLRDDVIPAATAGTGLDVQVTGGAAIAIDITDYLAERMLLFFGAVLTLSFVLLLVVFRSVLVPLKAVLMNVLSIGAAYGIVVAVFQWGWAGELLGIEGGPINPYIPMMLFAIVFGLSMDYEVFMLSRIREEYLRTGDASTSVADGLASTARVITAAAAIMVVVFACFMLEDMREIKLFGLGLAVAVFLDATLVRMVVVPATMELLGRPQLVDPRLARPAAAAPRARADRPCSPSGAPRALPSGGDHLRGPGHHLRPPPPARRLAVTPPGTNHRRPPCTPPHPPIRSASTSTTPRSPAIGSPRPSASCWPCRSWRCSPPSASPPAATARRSSGWRRACCSSRRCC